MNSYKTIGIIGGQGPVSTADFYMRIIAYFQRELGAKSIQDFPPVIIFSVPTQDLIESVEDEDETILAIGTAIKKLEVSGSDFIVIACNSLQYLLDKFRTLVDIPILGMASVVTEYVKTQGYKTLGLLATDTTIRKDVYGEEFSDYGLKLTAPNEADQKNVQNVIMSKIAGQSDLGDKKRVLDVVKNLQKEGAEAARRSSS